MFINEENVVLETGVEVSLKTQLSNNRVMVAVDMSIDTVHSFEDLSNHAWEGFRELNTYSAGKYSLIVNVALDPAHQMFDISWCGHLRRAFVVLGILPKVLELIGGLHLRA